MQDRGQFEQWVDVIGRRRLLRELAVNRSTLARWIAGGRRIPGAVYALARLWAEGRLPDMGPAWAGWRFADGALTDPAGRRFDPGEIAALPYQRLAFDALQAHCARLEAQLIEAVRRQPRETANDAYSWPADVRARAYK